MKVRDKVFVAPVVFLSILFFFNTLLAGQGDAGKSTHVPVSCKQGKDEIVQKTTKLRMPFIANEGQMDKRVTFYANTFGGTVFVTKEGEIVYSLPGRDEGQETRVRGHGARVRETGYGPRVLGNVVQSKSGILDLFLISCSDPLSKIVSSDTGSTISPLKPKSETCGEQSRTISKIRGITLKEELVGGKTNDIGGEGKAITKVNYFRGKDPSQWKTNIPTYDAVTLGEVYKGIELRLKAYGDNVEKLFYVKPDANPDEIRVRLSGAKALKINKEGQLEAETDLGPVRFTKPVAYQEIDGKRVEVAVEYNLLNPKLVVSEVEPSKIVRLSAHDEVRNPKSEVSNSQPKTINSQPETRNPQPIYGFKLASYDKTRDLIIDPLLASTFLGGSYYTGDWYASVWDMAMSVLDQRYHYDSGVSGLFKNTELMSIAVDSRGDVFVAGLTYTPEFPVTQGAYDTSFEGGYNVAGYFYSDIFVARLNGDLTSLLASTALGGSDDERNPSLAIDTEGNVFVAGGTFSPDFPTTPGAYDTSHNGWYDGFVSRLSGDLTRLLESTFLGGSRSDSVTSVAIDSGGVWVAGSTVSPDFPTTPGAYDTSIASSDVFVSRLNGNLTGLLASTVLGGDGNDWVMSLAIDPAGDVFVAGWSETPRYFPTTPGAYDTSWNDDWDGFVSKLNGGLTSLLASTFLGGSRDDHIDSAIIDPGGNIYVTGWTNSSDFPVTPGAYDTSHDGSDGTTFISLLNRELTSLLASTFLGGGTAENGGGPFSIAIDSGGDVWVAGGTGTPDFPTTPGAYDTSHNGRLFDGFVSRLNGDLTSLMASTFLGGSSGNNCAMSIAIGPGGDVFIAGWSSSSDFPTTLGAYDISLNGAEDAFIAKFDRTLLAQGVLPGSQACYSFEEGVGDISGDSSGNGHNGAVNGAVWTTGKSGGGLSFDGINDYVSVPRINNDEISLEAWFYKNANDTKRSDAIFGGWRWDPEVQLREGFCLNFFSNVPDRLRFIVVTMDAQGKRTQRTAATDLGNSLGSWYHVVGTYNKTTGEQKLYVNGQLVDTRKHPAGNTVVPLTYYPDMKIGVSGPTGFFYGIIDEVRLYNRALKGQEVEDLYDS